jgi:hypothetical protein
LPELLLVRYDFNIFSTTVFNILGMLLLFCDCPLWVHFIKLQWRNARYILDSLAVCNYWPVCIGHKHIKI